MCGGGVGGGVGEVEEKKRLANEKTHIHQGPRSHLINWLVKRRKITM